MGARTTRRRPLPVARRHRQGLLCRPVTDWRVPPARPSVSFFLVLSRLLSAPLQALFSAHTYIPLPSYRTSTVSTTAPSCVSLARVCASAFSSFSAAGRSYSSFHSCSRCGFCACVVDCLFPCRLPVVHLYHRSFHTLTPAHAPHSPPTRA